jgi:hypothetical protein
MAGLTGSPVSLGRGRAPEAMWAKAIDEAGLPKGSGSTTFGTRATPGPGRPGANLRELMERMGHSSMRAALIYMHATQEASKTIAAGIDRQWSEAQRTARRRRSSGT